MLRIKFVISATGELEPTEYFLIDKYQAFTQNIKPKKRYYNANYLKANFAGGWSAFTLYYRRKLNLSDCVDNGITTIKVRNGGEFFDVNGMDALNQLSRYFVCQERRYLATFRQVPNTQQQYLHGKKKELATFLLVNNLADLKRTVHFELTWSDNVSMQLTNNVGQSVEAEFNIYEDDEDEENSL
jgi:hypothetical protein